MSLSSASARSALVIVALIACVAPTLGQPAPDLAGRTITIIASFEAGGQRTTARYRVLSVWQQQKNGWAMIANSTTAIQ